MPVDYQQIRNSIRSMGKSLAANFMERTEKQKRAGEILFDQANELSALQEKVSQALKSQPVLRCAVPVQEPLTSSIGCNAPAASTVIAADGSQINPSHHDAIEFAVINLAAITFSAGQAPIETVQSRLFAGDDLIFGGYKLNEEMIALLRDIGERKLVLQLTAGCQPPVLALTDGPLEIYGEPKTDPEFQKQFDEYLSALRGLAAAGVNVAGYVDKPGADLVVRLLELTESDEPDRDDKVRPFHGVTDASLLSGLIQPAQRSAIFGLQSRSALKFTAELELHFFYLNVGRKDHPALVRVEIPAWVAREPARIDLVHSTLLQQCRIMGAQAYPYILHRAHEIAVVKMDEKDGIAAMLAGEYYRQGIQPGSISSKQSAKNLAGKTRYEK